MPYRTRRLPIRSLAISVLLGVASHPAEVGKGIIDG